jgi:hypothetical protein
MMPIRVNYRQHLAIVRKYDGAHLTLPDPRDLAFRVLAIVIVWSVFIKYRAVLRECGFNRFRAEARLTYSTAPKSVAIRSTCLRFHSLSSVSGKSAGALSTVVWQFGQTKMRLSYVPLSFCDTVALPRGPVPLAAMMWAISARWMFLLPISTNRRLEHSGRWQYPRNRQTISAASADPDWLALDCNSSFSTGEMGFELRRCRRNAWRFPADGDRKKSSKSSGRAAGVQGRSPSRGAKGTRTDAIASLSRCARAIELPIPCRSDVLPGSEEAGANA